MRKFSRVLIFTCGLLLTLAAFPVFAQENQVRDVEINQKPFQDLIKLVKEKVDKKRVDLTKPFSVTVQGNLDKDGRLEATNTAFVKSEGDAEMINIGKTFIEAVNHSGILAYLKNTGIDKINLTVAQNESQLYVNIVSEQKTREKALTTASIFNIMLSALKMGIR